MEWYNPWLHILATMNTNQLDKLKNMYIFREYLSTLLTKYGLWELWSFYYLFDSAGFTWVVSLKESHVSIHTRPEYNFLTLDIFLCNYSQNNDTKAKNIFNEIKKYFIANVSNKHIIRR